MQLQPLQYRVGYELSSDWPTSYRNMQVLIALKHAMRYMRSGKYCDRLQKMLKDAGVRASRLGDIALARLYRACWGHANAGEQRFDRDVQAFFVAAGSA